MIAPLVGVAWWTLHLGSPGSTSPGPSHYASLAAALVVGSLVASGLYWYYSRRTG